MADILSFRPPAARPAPTAAAPGEAVSVRGELIVFPNVGIVRLVELGRRRAVPATPPKVGLPPRDAVS